MLRLETVLRILEGLRGEAMAAAENPPEDYRSEFGFGRVAGMLQFANRAIRLMNEEATEQPEEQPQPSFEEE